jgi:hypothetical protein
MNAPRNSILVLASLLTACLVACGGTTEVEKSSTQGAGGQGGSAGGEDQCLHDAPGKAFKFHIHNQGTRKLSLAFGCGSFPVFTADTAKGKVALAPDPGGQVADGFTCDAIFDGGSSQGAYGDCGPGYGADLSPGLTVDLTWDRRSYDRFNVPAECSGHPMNNDCFLGTAISSSKMQTGDLDICADGVDGNGFGVGYCSKTETVKVTFDTTGDEATIEVM